MNRSGGTALGKPGANAGRLESGTAPPKTLFNYANYARRPRGKADQDAIISAMRYANYNMTQATKILHASRVTEYSLIDKYNLHFVSSQGKSSQELE